MLSLIQLFSEEKSCSSPEASPTKACNNCFLCCFRCGRIPSLSSIDSSSSLVCSKVASTLREPKTCTSCPLVTYASKSSLNVKFELLRLFSDITLSGYKSEELVEFGTSTVKCSALHFALFSSDSWLTDVKPLSDV
ncbi:hypothetical protein V8G54_008841 [Vigna mungo]|uniref:Uncharacterized protein n=1 Tax=Vigna mungo TaxID=3915 RepID=A0AAQ3S6V9_VIGMU